MLIDLLTDAVHQAPDGAAVVTAEETVTFTELLRRVEARAAQIAAMTEAGDRVAVLAENCVAYVELYYAAPLADRILVPLNHRLHPEEWRATIAAADARVLFGDPALLDRCDSSVPMVPFSVPPTPALVVFAAPTATEPTNAEESGAPRARSDHDVAWLIGTSGTTGTPKLAMLSDANLLAAVEATLPARPVEEDDVLFTPFPLCHVAGYNVFVAHRRARPIVLQRSFDPVGLAALVRKHRVTMLSLAPTMIAMLLDHPDIDDADLATVRALGYGASPIPAPVLQRVIDRWNWDCSQGFGMTELAGNAAFLGPDDHRGAASGDERLLAAAGRPSPGVEVRLAPDDELLIRAPQVMRGYWNDARATTDALDGGWLHTGDIARIDDDGLISIVDRKKDVIVTGGENVASREVEAVLFQHPAVKDVAVIGLPHHRWGEQVCAVVVAREAVDAETLITHCRDQLAGFKTPRRIEFTAALPRNASGKVLKHQLRTDLATGLQMTPGDPRP